MLVERLPARYGRRDGGDTLLLRRLRVHGNFAEYAPMGIVLMILAELQNASSYAVHGIGILLVVGRVVHALGLGREPDMFPFRVVGMILTLTALIAGALVNLALPTLFTSSV